MRSASHGTSREITEGDEVLQRAATKGHQLREDEERAESPAPSAGTKNGQRAEQRQDAMTAEDREKEQPASSRIESGRCDPPQRASQLTSRPATAAPGRRRGRHPGRDSHTTSRSLIGPRRHRAVAERLVAGRSRPRLWFGQHIPMRPGPGSSLMAGSFLHCRLRPRTISRDRLRLAVPRKTTVDDKRFDEIAKLLTGPASRRSTVRSCYGGRARRHARSARSYRDRREEERARGREKKKGCRAGARAGKRAAAKGSSAAMIRARSVAERLRVLQFGSRDRLLLPHPPAAAASHGVTTPHPPSAAHRSGSGSPTRDWCAAAPAGRARWALALPPTDPAAPRRGTVPTPSPETLAAHKH